MKKHKKAKWLSEETLQIVEKRRDMKGKGEKEKYIHLNTDFGRIARKDKTATPSDQWKEMENYRLGKTREFLKQIGDTQEAVHEKTG